MTKKSGNASLSKTIELYGVKIKKMPCGKYFEALEQLKELPSNFLLEAFNGKKVKLSSMMNVEGIVELVMKFLAILPEFTMNFLAKLLDVEADKLKNDVTPYELLQIIKKFIEINELESFFQEMKPIMKNIQKAVQKIGFNEQSVSALKLASLKKNS